MCEIFWSFLGLCPRPQVGPHLNVLQWACRKRLFFLHNSMMIVHTYHVGLRSGRHPCAHASKIKANGQLERTPCSHRSAYSAPDSSPGQTRPHSQSNHLSSSPLGFLWCVCLLPEFSAQKFRVFVEEWWANIVFFSKNPPRMDSEWSRCAQRQTRVSRAGVEPTTRSESLSMTLRAAPSKLSKAVDNDGTHRNLTRKHTASSFRVNRHCLCLQVSRGLIKPRLILSRRVARQTTATALPLVEVQSQYYLS